LGPNGYFGPLGVPVAREVCKFGFCQGGGELGGTWGAKKKKGPPRAFLGPIVFSGGRAPRAASNGSERFPGYGTGVCGSNSGARNGGSRRFFFFLGILARDKTPLRLPRGMKPGGGAGPPPQGLPGCDKVDLSPANPGGGGTWGQGAPDGRGSPRSPQSGWRGGGTPWPMGGWSGHVARAVLVGAHVREGVYCARAKFSFRKRVGKGGQPPNELTGGIWLEGEARAQGCSGRGFSGAWGTGQRGMN